MNSVVSVKTHHELPKVSEQEVRENGGKVLADADQGIQTAVVADDGKTITAVIGLNGFRYLPDPDPDPLDEMLGLALDAARNRNK